MTSYVERNNTSWSGLFISIFIVAIISAFFVGPWYFRYQARADARNEVLVNGGFSESFYDLYSGRRQWCSGDTDDSGTRNLG